ncbi:unnamed protein product [Gordionus sp. m RMFG-2023]
MADACLKWIDYQVLDLSTKVALDKMKDFSGKIWLMKAMVSGGGQASKRNELRQFYCRWNIQQLISPLYYPKSNGQVERIVAIVKLWLKRRLSIFSYNNVKTTKGRSPADVGIY